MPSLAVRWAGWLTSAGGVVVTFWRIVDQSDVVHSDFSIFYSAAWLWCVGGAPYDMGAARLFLWPTAVPDEMMLYFGPPALLPIVAPFTYLGPLWAQFVWTTGVIAAGIWAVRALTEPGALLRAWWFALPPALSCVRAGQLALFMLAAFVVIRQHFAGRRGAAAAGAALVLLAIKPLFVVAPVALLLWRRRWKPVAVAAGILVVLTAIASTLRPSLLSEYVAVLAHATQLVETSAAWRSNTTSLQSIAQLSVHEAEVRTLLSILVLAIWVALRSVRLLPVVGLLISPHVLVYDLALALAALRVGQRRTFRQDVCTLIPWLALWVVPPPGPAVVLLVVLVWPLIARLRGTPSGPECGKRQQLVEIGTPQQSAGSGHRKDADRRSS